VASTSRYATPARRSASTLFDPVTYTRPASRAALDVASNARCTSATAFEQVPLVDARGRPDLGRVSSSRCWSLAGGKAGSDGDAEGGYELLGFARKPLRQVVQVAKNLGLYAGSVADRELAPDWAEAHFLRLPPGDTLAWRRFSRWIGLHQPDRCYRRRRTRAA
jgi:hypothetical protein